MNLATFPWLFIPDKVCEKLETARSYSDKRGIENKQKFAF